jgi:hypothetical protein
VAQRRDGRTPVRRVYSAHIEGRQSDVTVVVYEGENAEEVCMILHLCDDVPLTLTDLVRTGSAKSQSILDFGEIIPHISSRWIKCINQSPKSHSALWDCQLVRYICYSLPRRFAIPCNSLHSLKRCCLELVPILRFIQEYRHSMIYTIYLYGYLVSLYLSTVCTSC